MLVAKRTCSTKSTKRRRKKSHRCVSMCESVNLNNILVVHRELANVGRSVDKPRRKQKRIKTKTHSHTSCASTHAASLFVAFMFEFTSSSYSMNYAIFIFISLFDRQPDVYITTYTFSTFFNGELELLMAFTKHGSLYSGFFSRT